jgi:hypothetical protein
VTNKGDKYPSNGKLTYKLSGGATLDASLSDTGKAVLTLSKPELLPNISSKLSATVVPAVADAKLNLSYAWASVPAVGGKAVINSDMGLHSKKVVTSVGYTHSTLLLGAEAEYDAAKGAISKYTLGAQAPLASGDTCSLLLVDNSKTLKLAYVRKLDKTYTAGAEVAHALKSGATDGALALSAKLDTGVAKALFNSKGAVSLAYAHELTKNTVVSLCIAGDSISGLASPKFGVGIKVAA